MKQLTVVICAGLLALVLWRITENISSDALGLAIGVVFGVLAGLPTAVLVLAGNQLNRQRQLSPPTYNIIVADEATAKRLRSAGVDAIEVRR